MKELPPLPGDSSDDELPTAFAGKAALPMVKEKTCMNEVPVRHRTFSWENFGGEGFLISIAIHILLAIIAIFFVLRRYAAPEKREDSDVFSTGAGGGGRADKPQSYERKIEPRTASPIKSISRVVSRGAGDVSLPDTPAAAPSAFAKTMPGGAFSGGTSSGAGGGGETGIGIGLGGGKNFAGYFLGTKQVAKRVAVYLDASGSMRPYLARVEAEAKACFPEADVYRFNGIYVYIEDGAVTWGSSGRSDYKRKAPADGAANDPARFGDLGKKILRHHEAKFTRGSVGAWFDHLITEKYDALIIFSDFRDGVRQYDKAGTLVFEDRPKARKDSRTTSGKAWEQRWIRILAKAAGGGAPKVHLYSLSIEPQEVWKRCVEASGGSVTMVPWMRNPAGHPPEDGGLEKTVEAVNRGKGRTDTPVRPR